jgi:hypothetical protein
VKDPFWTPVEQVGLLLEEQPYEPVPLQGATVNALRVLARHESKSAEATGGPAAHRTQAALPSIGQLEQSVSCWPKGPLDRLRKSQQDRHVRDSTTGPRDLSSGWRAASPVRRGLPNQVPRLAHMPFLSARLPNAHPQHQQHQAPAAPPAVALAVEVSPFSSVAQRQLTPLSRRASCRRLLPSQR